MLIQHLSISENDIIIVVKLILNFCGFVIIVSVGPSAFIMISSQSLDKRV